MTSTIKGPGLGLSKYGDIVRDPDSWEAGSLIPDTEGFVEVVSVGGGGYDWAEFNCWYDTTSGQYYWDGQSGCSCDTFEIWGGLGGLESGDRAAAIRGLKSFLGWGSHDFNERQRAEIPARLRNFDPRRIQEAAK